MTEESVIAVCGPVDAGKSSLIGVLTTGQFINMKEKQEELAILHLIQLNMEKKVINCNYIIQKIMNY